MTRVPAWRHSFQTLGLAFIIIGSIATVIGMATIIMLATPTSCPANGCAYNLGTGITANLFPSGLTLIIAGIVVIWMVKIESDREDRGSS